MKHHSQTMQRSLSAFQILWPTCSSTPKLIVLSHCAPWPCRCAILQHPHEVVVKPVLPHATQTAQEPRPVRIALASYHHNCEQEHSRSGVCQGTQDSILIKPSTGIIKPSTGTECARTCVRAPGNTNGGLVLQVYGSPISPLSRSSEVV